jgi:hypothetical protein
MRFAQFAFTQFAFAWGGFWVGAVSAPLFAGCASPNLEVEAAASRARASIYLLDECAVGHPCDPAIVRAIERPQLCSAEGTLARAGATMPDGGVQCPPR